MSIDQNSRPQKLNRAGIALAAVFAISVAIICVGMARRDRHVLVSPKVAAVDNSAPAKMTDMLKLVATGIDPESTIFANHARAAIDLDQLKQLSPDNPEAIDLRWHYAGELLKSGQTEQALAEFKANMDVLRRENPVKAREMYPKVLMAEALCYMRMGEDQNCCTGHSPHACLLPIRSTGIHQKKEGSLGAIAMLTKVLDADPGNLNAKWLINIAYMTLGGYPAKVPAAWLIQPKVFQSDYDLKRFPNIAPALGLDFRGRAGGVIMEDFDGDGYLDLMISSMDPNGQLRYMHNNGDGTFTDRTKEAGLMGETGGLNIIQTDYNNDGKPDVLVLRGGWMGKGGHMPLSLLRNNGDGTFTDVTIQAGLLRLKPTQAAVWLDYNNDGWLDLFVGNESSSPDDPNPCELFRNNHDGTFTDVATECGIDKVAFVKAVVSADYNNDGRPDLYLSCQGQPNMLFRNDGPAGPDKSWNAPWKFTETGHQAGVDKQKKSFSCFFFDYDNDGWPDLYVNGYGIKDVSDVAADYLGLPTSAERARLYHNNHDGTFSDVTKAAHLYKVNQGMGVNFGDLDNDGWLDFYVGTGNPEFDTLIPKRMFRNAGGKYFQEVTTSGDFGHLQKGHGIAFGDINNTGKQDVFTVLGGAYEGDLARCAFFKNPGFGNHWIELKLEGVQSNRAAIGAVIKVDITEAGGVRSIYKTVGSGGSFGANPFRQEIGLGKASAIRSVSIYWPATGQTQTLTGLKMDQFYQVREGDAAATPWALKSFPLPDDPDDGNKATMTAMAKMANPG